MQSTFLQLGLRVCTQEEPRCLLFDASPHASRVICLSVRQLCAWSLFRPARTETIFGRWRRETARGQAAERCTEPPRRGAAWMRDLGRAACRRRRYVRHCRTPLANEAGDRCRSTERRKRDNGSSVRRVADRLAGPTARCRIVLASRRAGEESVSRGEGERSRGGQEERRDVQSSWLEPLALDGDAEVARKPPFGPTQACSGQRRAGPPPARARKRETRALPAGIRAGQGGLTGFCPAALPPLASGAFKRNAPSRRSPRTRASGFCFRGLPGIAWYSSRRPGFQSARIAEAQFREMIRFRCASRPSPSRNKCCFRGVLRAYLHRSQPSSKHSASMKVHVDHWRAIGYWGE